MQFQKLEIFLHCQTLKHIKKMDILLTGFFGVSFADIVDAFEWAAKIAGGTGSIWFVASAGKWFVRKRDDNQPDNPTISND